MRELFQSNFALKIFSLILATLLWFAIESNLHRNQPAPANPFSNEAPLALTCPVATLVSPAAKQHVAVTPDRVVVRITGSPEVLSELESSNVTVFVTLPDKLETEELLSVNARVPDSIHLVSIEPAEVSVKPLAPDKASRVSPAK